MSQKTCDGKLYRKKFHVIDTPNRYEFSLKSDDAADTRTYENLQENDFETVLPPIQGEVLILKGEFKGESGILISRDKKRDECIVQVGLDASKYSQDDIASKRS